LPADGDRLEEFRATRLALRIWRRSPARPSLMSASRGGKVLCEPTRSEAAVKVECGQPDPQFAGDEGHRRLPRRTQHALRAAPTEQRDGDEDTPGWSSCPPR
jgi:hypothetical protein